MQLLASMLALLLCAKLLFPTYVQLANADDIAGSLVICTSTGFAYQTPGELSDTDQPMIKKSGCVWCQSGQGLGDHAALPSGSACEPTVHIEQAEELADADERVALAVLSRHYQMRAPPAL